MVSLSHWGMFAISRPTWIVPGGFEFDEASFRQPGHVVWMPKGAQMPMFEFSEVNDPNNFDPNDNWH